MFGYHENRSVTGDQSNASVLIEFLFLVTSTDHFSDCLALPGYEREQFDFTRIKMATLKDRYIFSWAN